MLAYTEQNRSTHYLLNIHHVSLIDLRNRHMMLCSNSESTLHQ